MYRVFYLCLLAMTLSAPALKANASPLASEAISRIENGDEPAATYTTIYFYGLLDGFGLANAELKERNAQLLFCEPDNINITAKQASKMLSDFVKKHPALGKITTDAALLSTLEDAFPCR